MIITIDEAIRHAEQTASFCKIHGEELCAKEHELLVGWLEELKQLKQALLTKEEAAVLLYETASHEELPEEVALFIDHVSETKYRELRESGRAKLEVLFQGGG